MPTIITPAEVSRIAALSRLGLTIAEEQEAASKLGSILQHFTLIQAIDTAGVAPTDAMSGLVNVSRPDVIWDTPLCETTALLAGAPATYRNHVQVKAVL